ncbi:MAG: hypothetical protein LBO66_00185 [Deltaproteobacteria bacterium]|jgi:predicted acetyltransferase|nr:hypothetical protein [Deltaproteobacteria bacterium]
MTTKNSIENEIDAIRVALYEKTKHMSPKELNAYIHEQNVPIYKKFGIKAFSNLDEYNRSKILKSEDKDKNTIY